jgi:hypothetical protein
VVISQRVPPKFNAFQQEEGLKGDIDVVADGARLPAHRILLARHSNWFHRELQKPEYQPGNGSRPAVQLQGNLYGQFPQFLNLLYTGQLILDDNNIIPLLCISVLYEFPEYERIFRHFLASAFVSAFDRSQAKSSEADAAALYETVLTYAKRLAEANLDDQGAIAKFVALSKVDLTDPNCSTATKNHLYDSLSPLQFTQLLKQPRYEPLDPGRKITLISEYLDELHTSDRDRRPVITDTVKTTLASLFDWSKADYTNFLDLPFTWVPDTYAAPLLLQILKRRSNRLNQLSNRKTAATVRPWFIASYLHFSASRDGRPEFPIIGYLSSLGLGRRVLDPVEWRLVAIGSNVKDGALKITPPKGPVETPFATSGLLSKDRYFLAFRDDKLTPEVWFDFGQAGFEVKALRLSTLANKPDDVKRLQELPTGPHAPKYGWRNVHLIAKASANSEEQHGYRLPVEKGQGGFGDDFPNVTEPRNFKDTAYIAVRFSLLAPGDGEEDPKKLHILESKLDLANNRVARLSEFEVKGVFLP